MTNNSKIIAECYKQFDIKNTSLSTARLPHSIRVFKKHILTKEENNTLTNAGLTGGTMCHDIVQECLTKNTPLDDVIKSEYIQTKIAEFTPIHEKDKMKFKFIVKFLKPICQNHLDNIKELLHLNQMDKLEKQVWKDEVELTAWTPPVKIYWKMFLDLVSQVYFGDLKNKFGSASYKPLKNKKAPINENRIGDWVYSKPKMDDKIYFSDLMQIALYHHAIGLKPFLSYASHDGRKLFTEDNCEDLKPENLKKWLKQLMVYEISWQKKLEAANGDLKELCWLSPPDYSDIKKNSFWWDGVPKEYIERYLKYYD